MNTTKSLTLGLLLLILLWILMLYVEWGKIEQDVGGRTQHTLEEAGHNWVNVFIDGQGRDISLSGIARTQQNIDDVQNIAKNVDGVRAVEISGVELREYLPADLSVTIYQGEITLEGTMQNLEISEGIASAAKSGGVVVNNIDTNDDIGIPQWLDGVTAAFPALGALENGLLTIVGDKLLISGIARNQGDFDTVQNVVKDVPGINQIESSGLLLKEYLPAKLSVNIDGGELTLAGGMQTQEISDDIAAALAVMDGKIENNIVIDDEIIIPQWLDSIKTVFPSLSSLQGGLLTIDGEQLSLSGIVRTQAEFDQANRALANMQGVSTMDSSGLQMIPLKPAALSMKMVDNVMTLSGRLGSLSGLGKLIASARNAFTNVDASEFVFDKNTRAVSWVDDAAKIMVGLTGIQDPGLSVEGGTISVSGIARSDAASAALNSALAGTEGGAVESYVAIKPWQEPTLNFTYNQGNSLLSGELPDQSMLDLVTAAASKISADVNAENLIINSDTSEPEWIARLASVIAAIDGLEQVNLAADNNGISLNGVVQSENDRDRIVENIKTVLDGESIEDSLALSIGVEQSPEAVAASICEQTMDNLLEQNTIEFNTESADINENSFELLSELMDAINSCPQAVIEIGGHTDSFGDDAYNQSLSENRANAVVAYFVDAGIDQARLAARGYGSSLPVADNATASGRALNRRIEINIITSRL